MRGISLHVGPGEFVSLLGASGCGKSTVLRLAAGLEAPSRGSVAVPHGAGGDVAFVFQEPTLMPWASVFDNVWLPLRLAGQRRAAAAARVQEALATVGLSTFAEAYPAQLSGGMKMRASIARALVTRPQVLLMDEPFAALDAQNRSRMQEEMGRILASDDPLVRKTMVLVTHSIEEAILLSDHVVVLTRRPGRVKAQIRVDLPRPRNEGDPAFVALRERIRALIHDEFEIET